MGQGGSVCSAAFPDLHGCVPESMATFELYARLNISLMRSNSRAMLSRS